MPADDLEGVPTSPLRYLAVDHVLIAMPPHSERRAREFYVDLLGFTEVPRAESLAGRGGGWFVGGGVSIHLGVDTDFHPAGKAHVALRVSSLSAVLERCSAAGCEVWHDVPIPGYRRAHLRDPFGNRIEFMERLEAPLAEEPDAP